MFTVQCSLFSVQVYCVVCTMRLHAIYLSAYTKAVEVVPIPLHPIQFSFMFTVLLKG